MTIIRIAIILIMLTLIAHFDQETFNGIIKHASIVDFLIFINDYF